MGVGKSCDMWYLIIAGWGAHCVSSRGNVNSTLGKYQEAREDFVQSRDLFQTAKGFRKGASTTARLDGAIYASLNAALMLVQLGDDLGALREMEAVRRRAPNSSDVRAALSALYWSNGDQEKAEDLWDFTCGKLLDDCAKYQDVNYLSNVRRWPPIMIEKMQRFRYMSSVVQEEV